MERIVTLNTNRSEYDIRDAAARSFTVRQLIEELECNYDLDDKIVFSNDNGYTYGYIGAGYIDAHRVETHEEEAERECREYYREKMEELRDELLDYEDMSEEEYNQRRKELFEEYGVSEEEYNNFVF